MVLLSRWGLELFEQHSYISFWLSSPQPKAMKPCQFYLVWIARVSAWKKKCLLSCIWNLISEFKKKLLLCLLMYFLRFYVIESVCNIISHILISCFHCYIKKKNKSKLLILTIKRLTLNQMMWNFSWRSVRFCVRILDGSKIIIVPDDIVFICLTFSGIQAVAATNSHTWLKYNNMCVYIYIYICIYSKKGLDNIIL